MSDVGRNLDFEKRLSKAGMYGLDEPQREVVLNFVKILCEANDKIAIRDRSFVVGGDKDDD
jgi:hypothetical protein